jgi:rod shape-determining protein MreC
MFKMKNSKFKNIVFYLLAVMAIFLVAVFFIGNNISDVFINFVVKTNSRIFSSASGFRVYISGLDNINKLNKENIQLKRENTRILTQLAKINEVMDENSFLRESLGISAIKDSDIEEGGVFNINYINGEHTLLINRGVNHGIKEGHIIITSDGVLIGTVKEVLSNYSRVEIITSPNFKTTVKVLESRVAAIAKGASSDGLYLDFISQQDIVTEGEFIVTSGNDLIPAGLIIGIVNMVKIDATSLFKEVRIHPLLKDIDISKILIIKI